MNTTKPISFSRTSFNRRLENNIRNSNINHSVVEREISLDQEFLTNDRSFNISTDTSTPLNIIEDYTFLDDYEENILSDSDSETELEFVDVDLLRKQLSLWAKECNITLISVTKLLVILRSHGHSELPKVAQTLLSTPTHNQIVPVDPGHYIHIGIEKNILKLLKLISNLNDIDNIISMDVNVDGVPITNSTRKQFWPILGRCVEISKYPFPIGIFYGLKKPTSSSDLFEHFISEIEHINENGISFQNRTYFVQINAFICDAPAQSFVKCIVGHNGYSGCGKCTQSGEWHGRLYFPEIEFEKRTDLSFKNKTDEDHHKGFCHLENLGIGMVSQFPADYLHLCCLGVVKKLIQFWLKGPLRTRLPSFDINKISERLLNCCGTQPNEFQRRIRGLEDFHYFKGTEFRTFIFYTGPVVLKDILSNAGYKNFLALHIALRICNDVRFRYLLDIARKLLVYFVETFADIYGEEFLSYNVHNLLHLVDDCELFGILDEYSAYPFESFLGKIKKSVRQGNKILEQAVNRVLEGWELDLKSNKINEEYPVLKKLFLKNEDESRYSQIKFENAFFKNDMKNCYFMDFFQNVIKFEYAKVTTQGLYICGRKFLIKENLYVSPIESSLFGIFNLKLDLGEIETFKYENIKCKAFVMKQENIIASFAMHDIN